MQTGMTVLMCMCIVYLLTITESYTEKEKTEQMRGKSKCPIIFWAKLEPAGKEKNRGNKHRQQQHQ